MNQQSKPYKLKQKLTLHRETIRTLTGAELGWVVGALPIVETNPISNCQPCPQPFSDGCQATTVCLMTTAIGDCGSGGGTRGCQSGVGCPGSAMVYVCDR